MKGVILATLISTNSNKICIDHKIYCQIIKNSPSIDRNYAMTMSNYIYKFSKKYGISSRVYTAILAQESMYKLNAKNCTKGLHKDYMIPVEACSDFGISQIHYNNIPRFKFNVGKLLNNLEYSIEAGFKVLHDIKKRVDISDKDWYTRYNCGLKGTTKRETCQRYKKLVEKYL